MTRLTASERILLLAFLLVIAVPVQYLLRALDDNTLVSWRWTMSADRMLVVMLATGAAAAAAAWLSRAEVPGPWHMPLLFILPCIAVAPLWSVPETIIDASRYFLQAKHLALQGPASFLREWGGTIPAWTDLPAVPFAYGSIFRYAGESRSFIQLFTTVLFSLTVVLTFLLGRRIWDEQHGFLSGLLLLCSPYLLVQVPMMLVDVPVMFLLTLAVTTYLWAVERGGAVPIAVAAASIALASLSKYSVLPMLLILPVLSFVAHRRGTRAVLRRTAAVLGASALLIGGAMLALLDVVLQQWVLLRSYQWPALGRWGESALSTLLFQVHPFVGILAAAAAFVSLTRRDVRILIPCWSVVFAVVLHVDRIRYLIPLFPLLALMAAYGISALLPDRRTQRFTAYGMSAASVMLALLAYLPFLSGSTMANLQRAGNYLDGLPGSSAAVSVEAQLRSSGNTEMAVPLLDLYTRKRLFLHRGRQDRPDADTVRTSPLRFTWEIALPAFYDPPLHGTGRMPHVIIAGGGPGDRHEGSSLMPQQEARSFAADSGAFRYRTAVTVYDPSVLAETAQQPPDTVPFGTVADNRPQK